MSFVNDVMAEEADRKGLILFDDYSIIKSIDLPPIHDTVNVKKKYWITFSVILIALAGILTVIDQLPVTNRSIERNVSHQPIVGEQTLMEENTTEALIESTLLVVEEPLAASEVVVPVQQERASQKITKTVPVVAVESQAEIQLKNTEVEFEVSNLENNSVLDLTKKSIVFEKKSTSSQTEGLNRNSQYQSAQRLLEQGSVSQAITALNNVLANDKNHIEARLLLASSLLDNKQKSQAISVYKEGLLLHKKEARFAQPLAHLLTSEGQQKEALQVLIPAAPDYRSAPEYHSMMAALYQQTGQHGNAIAIYKSILNLEINNGKWWLGLGISLMAKSQNKEALAAFEWSLRDERVPVALKQFASQRINDLKVRGRL